MSLIEVKNLSLALETPQGKLDLIQHVEFSLDPGEKLGIVGESGCGKSLTALAIMALLPRTISVQGDIRFQGESLVEMPEKRMQEIRGNRIAMIFQEPMNSLNPVQTIGSQIAEGLRWHYGLNKSDAADKTRLVMDRVGLPVSRISLKLYPHQLSGGQRQRVMIALAIACEPDLLIADEPTTALDVTVQETILELINDIAEKSGMGLIMISHDLGVIAQTTEQVMVMYAGNTVESGTTPDIFADMRHPYTYGLFASMPKPKSEESDERSPLYSIPGQVPGPGARLAGCPFIERCFKAKEDCRQHKPPLQVLTHEHKVACYHPLMKSGA